MSLYRTIAVLAAVLATSCGPADHERPTVTHVATVAQDVLGITIRTGRVEYGRQEPYRRQDGDEIVEQGKYKPVWLKRGGKIIGTLVGADRHVLWRFAKLDGPLLDAAWADRTESYLISSAVDPEYRTGLRPLAVHRKTKPTDMVRVGRWDFAFPQVHVVYLRLPRTLKAGRTYRVVFQGEQLDEVSYRHDPATNRSEAVHVNQLGFRPDDPIKLAFLSCWLGDGGKLDYPEGLGFQVIEDRSGRRVFEGTTKLALSAEEKEDPYGRNYNLVDVYQMDFSPLRAPGTYRVVVEGVGSSYPFEIAEDVYRKAFRVAARGFYHQRSGIALGPPYTTYRRPRCFHADDGVKVYHSDCTLMESGNGLNVLGTDKDNFGNLVRGKTDGWLDNAWGGYFDAGDWDRRIQHLAASRLLLELVEMFPGYFSDVDLNIPESGDALPDVVNEALWNLDCYRRMQTVEGGIRGGIESAEHPKVGECSWQESLPVMAYSPGPWSSYEYAGVAARAAGWLQSRNPQLARVYQQSAIRAMQFGDRELGKYEGRMKRNAHHVHDARNLAAAELFRLTGEQAWHEVFLATTVFADAQAEVYQWQYHDQREAAFIYARTEREGANAEVRNNARRAILRDADAAADMARSTGFRWTKENAWRPVSYGVLGQPGAVTILRAHYLSGDSKYLQAAVLACQQAMGANPANVCYTTGLGEESPRHPLVVDARTMGVTPPPGLTVFGPMDLSRDPDYWTVKLLAPATHPAPVEWPTLEAWFDVYLFPVVTEFTVQNPMAATSYIWGYLAAAERTKDLGTQQREAERQYPKDGSAPPDNP